MDQNMLRKKCHHQMDLMALITSSIWFFIILAYIIGMCSCLEPTEPLTKENHQQTTQLFQTSTANINGNHSRWATTIASDELKRIRAASLSNYTLPNDQRKNTFIRSGNELWDSLIDECLQKPSFSCFQKNVYSYLDNTLKLDDVNVTEQIRFKKIDIDPDTLVQMQNDTDDENEIGDDGRAATFESESPIEEVTDAMYGKWRHFMMSHNLEVKMPEMLFDGATYRITPRSFEGDNGVLIKLEMIPKQVEVEARSTGRFFKKIKKLIKNKLMLSFLALILIIKLIKIKIFWILPLIVGVGAAKKLLLKFILFLFPALTHLFKLCSYYHKNYHDTKYHHHHHQINHLHTVVPPWYKEYVEHHGQHGHEYVHSPPKGHPAEYIHSLPHPHSSHATFPYPAATWAKNGLGSEFITDIHRNINVNTYQPNTDDRDTISSWGLADSHTIPKHSENNLNVVYSDAQPSASAYPAPTVENSIGRTPLSESRPSIVTAYNHLDPSSQLNYPQDKYSIAEKIQHAIRQPPNYAQTQNLIASDPFYGPIVGKIESILQQYSGYLDDNCKEWLICNMYKDPLKFSPHSNFLSAELSRDSTELQKPTTLNAAVLVFYKYVKAARDGQDQKDCYTLNSKCSMK